MKKVLYGTTALLAAGLIAGSASAASPVKLQLGGYVNWYVGYASLDDAHDGNYAAVDTASTARINFNGETKLDNGMKIGVFVETDNSDNQDVVLNQSYIYADSKVGRVTVGKMDGIDKQLHVGAKDVGLLDINESDAEYFLPYAGGEGVLGMAAYNLIGSKANTIAYFTPSMYGFTMAASYSTDQNTGHETNLDQNGNFSSYSVAGAYTYNLQGLDLGLSAAYSKADGQWNDNNPAGHIDNEWSVNAEIGYKGFAIGGGYKGTNLVDTVDMDVKTYSAGISYEQGPFGASVSWISEEADGKNDLYLASVKYSVCSGVDTFASFAFNSTEKDYKNLGLTDDEDNFAVITGIGLSF